MFKKLLILAGVAVALSACETFPGGIAGLAGAGGAGYGCARLAKHTGTNARLAITGGCAVAGGILGSYIGDGIAGGNRQLAQPQQQPQYAPGGYPPMGYQQQAPNVTIINPGPTPNNCNAFPDGSVVCQTNRGALWRMN